MYHLSKSSTFLIVIIVLFMIGIVASANIINSQNTPKGDQTASVNEAVAGSIKINIDSPYTDIQNLTVQSSTSNQTNTQTIKKPDEITAVSYLVGNLDTGKIYISKNPNDVSPVASMSKLITAIVATNEISPTTTIKISQIETEVPPDGSNLQAGEKFTFKELLYPMLLDSSNVAANAIASSSNLLSFLKDMSSMAWEIGMPDAYFADPSGLSPHNEASANNIFTLAKYLYKHRPDILAITRIPHISVGTTTNHGAHSFDSIHPFVNDPRFIGGKTGRTPEAGETMLTILRIGGQPIAFVILHSDYGERAADTDLLIKKYEELNLSTNQ